MYPVPNRPPDNESLADGRGPELTERQRRAVAVTATQIADEVRVDTALLAGREIDSAGAGSVLAELPPCTWARGSRWRRRLAQAFDDLAADVAAGTDPEPTCTGEQMALHIVVVTAAGRHLDGALDDLLHEVPAHPEDIDWISPLDFLFEDYDVLTLFDPEPVHDGVNLDPVDWFVPFEHHRARDPHRRYRC